MSNSPANSLEQQTIRSVAVYCGSSSGTNTEYTAAAELLGHEMAARNLALIYGGGRVGLMGTVANAVLEKGGTVHGIITKDLVSAEIAHTSLSTLDITNSMHERKAAMASKADAFLALPGGFGTLDELFEVLTWTQLGIHHKPVVLLNTCGYWQSLMDFTQHAANEGFMKSVHKDLLRVASTPREALDLLASPLPAPQPKWANR